MNVFPLSPLCIFGDGLFLRSLWSREKRSVSFSIFFSLILFSPSRSTFFPRPALHCFPGMSTLPLTFLRFRAPTGTVPNLGELLAFTLSPLARHGQFFPCRLVPFSESCFFFSPLDSHFPPVILYPVSEFGKICPFWGPVNSTLFSIFSPKMFRCSRVVPPFPKKRAVFFFFSWSDKEISVPLVLTGALLPPPRKTLRDALPSRA